MQDTNILSQSYTLIWSQKVSLENLATLASSITSELKKYPTFCLWLEGPLGAGKTTVVGHMLRSLGLASHIPITSPTYTYLNDYCIGDTWYGHIDCYRIADYTWEDYDMFAYHPYAGFFVEWPSLIQGSLLRATHRLEISPQEDNQTERTYSFYRYT